MKTVNFYGYEVSQNFKALLEHSLKDGKITDKERNAIYKRAENEGLSIEEVDILLDAVISEQKSDRKGAIKNYLLIFILSNIKVLSVVFVILVIIIIILIPPKEDRVKKRFNQAIENRNFEKAYTLLSDLQSITTYHHFDYHRDLLKIRIPYLINNNEHKLAMNELFELQYDIDIDYRYEFYQDHVMKIAKSSIEKQKFEVATNLLDNYPIYEEEKWGIGNTYSSEEERYMIKDYNNEVMNYNNEILLSLKKIIKPNIKEECIKYFKLWAKKPYDISDGESPYEKDKSQIDNMVTELLKTLN